MVRSASSTLCVALACVGAAERASAAGFQLFEHGASGLGTAFASTAAAEDASTIFWNPAGMSLLPGRNLAVAGHVIHTRGTFHNEGSRLSFAPIPLAGSGSAKPGGTAFIPNVFYSHPIAGSKLALGIGISSPFGLTTDYDAGWVGRYHALKSELLTLNVNPSISWRASDSVSLGLGINILYAKAELTNALDFGTICFGAPGFGPAPCTAAGFTPQASDGRIEIEGDDRLSYGFNAGAMFQLNQATRIGIAYRSRIKVKLEGDARFSGVPAPFAPTFRDQTVKADTTLPDTLSLGVRTDASSKLTLVGDLSWTNWSLFDELRVRFDAGFPDAVTPENWKDSWRVSFGALYRLTPAWTLRGGVAYDKSPVPDEFRTPRIPDQDRTWLAVGANYRVSQAGSLDIGYSRIFVKDASLDVTTPSGGRLIGTYDRAGADIFSVQYNHRF